MKSLFINLLLLLAVPAMCFAQTREDLEKQLAQKDRELTWTINKAYATYGKRHDLIINVAENFPEYFEKVQAYDGNPKFLINLPRKGTAGLTVYNELKDLYSEYEKLSIEHDKMSMSDPEYRELMLSDISDEEFGEKVRPAISRLSRNKEYVKTYQKRLHAMYKANYSALNVIAADYEAKNETMPTEWIPAEQLKEAKRSIHVKEIERQIKEIQRQIKKL